MKSRTNHKSHGQTNDSLLQDLLGLYSKTTASLHASLDALEIGINLKVIDKAVQMYKKGPLAECSDEARTLRFISPGKMSGIVEIVGECWDADINNWKNCRRQIPKKGAEAQDDFSALKRHILDVVHEDKLAKLTAIHNLAALSGLESTPLIYLIWPTPNKSYKIVHLLKVWDLVWFICFYDEENNFCQEPVLLLGHATDPVEYNRYSLVILRQTLLELGMVLKLN